MKGGETAKRRPRSQARGEDHTKKWMGSSRKAGEDGLRGGVHTTEGGGVGGVSPSNRPGRDRAHWQHEKGTRQEDETDRAAGRGGAATPRNRSQLNSLNHADCVVRTQ